MDLIMNSRSIASVFALSLLFLILPAACSTPPGTGPEACPSADAAGETGALGPGDPTKAAVPLGVGPGWDAFLVIDNGETGVWTVGAYPVFPQYGTPEIVGLDDQGRCLIMVGYSGKWTPMVLGHDGKWLGGLAFGDIDPRVSGSELYAGGQKGNLFQLTSYPQGAADLRLIAHLPGREIHTILAGELDPSNGCRELLVFTRPGGLYRVTPTGKDGTFETVHIQDLSGRVRDAVILPGSKGGAPGIVTVSRTGRLELLEMTAGGPRWSLIYEDAMGMGRVTLRPPAVGRLTTLYTSHDDGRIMRFERTAAGDWSVEMIYNGPQGPRGIAAGRFCADPDVESVAVFGYSSEVILLSRKGGGPWKDEVIFEDRDKGHWLSAAELDGRNATLEIIGSGYGSRIFMLSRPPGYGLGGGSDR